MPATVAVIVSYRTYSRRRRKKRRHERRREGGRETITVSCLRARPNAWPKVFVAYRFLFLALIAWDHNMRLVNLIALL